MKWEGNRESDNVEDRRGAGGGGGGGFGLGGRSIGIGTIVIALIGGAVFGVNPLQVLDMLSGGGGGVGPTSQPAVQSTPATDKQTRFVRVVLADTEDVWGKLFQEKGGTYAPPKLVVFSGATATACGTGQSASGPFYCPADQDVYIDLSFYSLMQERFGVSGEFAQAYVIAHEIGHHVQNQLGTSGKVRPLTIRGGTVLLPSFARDRNTMPEVYSVATPYVRRICVARR